MKIETITSNDRHIDESNIDQIKDLVVQLCLLAKKYKVDKVFCLGDIFKSKISQKIEILAAFGEILDIFESYNITLIAFPGNHDKHDYRSDSSFLSPYKHYPNFKLYEKEDTIQWNKNIKFHIVPYYEESTWLERLQKVKKNIDSQYINILLSHQEFTGSSNNDCNKIENSIKISDVNEFDFTYLGHFHNESQLGEKVFHLPSIQQNNFGENNRKGFTLIYEDGTNELVKSTFKEYKKITIDLDKLESDDINNYIKEYAKDPNNIRFEITGDEAKIKALKKDKITQNGIEFTTKTKEVDNNMDLAEANEVIEFTKDSIEEEFVLFCDESEINVEEGIKYLLKKLGKQ